MKRILRPLRAKTPSRPRRGRRFPTPRKSRGTRTTSRRPTDPVRAAGGVVWRRREPDGAAEVVLVHRPRYDDWTFPKGKAEAGETDEDCALREVREETGLECRLGGELPSTSYADGRGRPKVVRWWAMEPTGGALAAATEADEARWVPLADAAPLLTYERDRELARAAADVLA